MMVCLEIFFTTYPHFLKPLFSLFFLISYLNRIIEYGTMRVRLTQTDIH